MKKFLYFLVLAVLLAGLLLSCAPKPAPTPTPTPTPSPAPTPAPEPAPPTEPIVLEAVTFLPTYIPLIAPVFEILIPAINEALKGELTIELLGGPELFPDLEQPEAVRTGIVDISFTVGGDYPQLVPEADLMYYTEYTPWEEREVGVYDFWVDAHKKANLYYLGRWLWGGPGYFHFTGTRVENLSDLVGLKVADVYGEGIWVDKFGMVQVDMTGEEFHTALERGIIDGFNWARFGYFPGWEEVVDYVLDEPFNNLNMAILVNLDAWNSIPNHLQERLIEVVAEFEHQSAVWTAEQFEKETEIWLNAGVEYLKLPPGESTIFVETIDDGIKEYYIALDPVVYTKVIDTIRK